jgi:hypothetical protein
MSEEPRKGLFLFKDFDARVEEVGMRYWNHFLFSFDFSKSKSAFTRQLLAEVAIKKPPCLWAGGLLW